MGNKHAHENKHDLNTALESYKNVYAAGSNISMQLGLDEPALAALKEKNDDDSDRVMEPVLLLRLSHVAKIAGGDDFCLALTKDGEIHVCGNNKYGQLGTGDTKNVAQWQVNHLSKSHKVHDVCCGSAHSLVLLSDGKLYSFGDNNHGQLGTGTTEQSLVPQLIAPHKHFCMIACGYDHNMALSTQNELYVWGRNSVSQLGLIHDEDVLAPKQNTYFNDLPVKALACGAEHSVVLLENGQVYAFGRNIYGQLGLHDHNKRTIPEQITALSTHTIAKISCGSNHTIVQDAKGTLYVFGYNYFGTLGLNHTNNVADPTALSITGHKVVHFVAFGESSAIFYDDGSVLTCGRNDCGQLGLGHVNDTHTFTKLKFAFKTKKMDAKWSNLFLFVE